MPAIIEVMNVHNHAVGTAASLIYLRPSDDVRQQFEEHFSNGLGVTDAVRHHVNTLMLDDVMDEQKLANGSINPSYNTVRWWHDQWRLKHLGPRTGRELLDVCIFCQNIFIPVLIHLLTVQGGPRR